MKNTKVAFNWIIDILEQNNIKYKVSGGFATRVYGVNRELADIDIEVSDVDIGQIAQSDEIRPYIVYGPNQYKDENWDLLLMTLNYEGQDIDIAGTGAKIFNTQTKGWEYLDSSLDNITIKEVYGRKIPVENIKSLIAYKTKLAREVDLEDVRQLRSHI